MKRKSLLLIILSLCLAICLMAASCSSDNTDSSSSTESSETKSEADVSTDSGDSLGGDVTDSSTTTDSIENDSSDGDTQSSSVTDSSDEATDSSDEATDSSDEATDSSDEATDSSDETTDSSDETTDSSDEEPENEPCKHQGGEATCASLAICDICGLEYGEFLPHTEEFVEGKDATCRESGLTDGTKCSVCDMAIEAQEEIARKEHLFNSENICGMCGRKKPSDGLEILCNYDGTKYTVTVVGTGDCTDADIVIPDFYEGLPVTSISEYAFYFNQGLTSVTIPSCITTIDKEAFDNAPGLTIYCEAAEKPDGWHEKWNNMNSPVVWDCINNRVADDGCEYAVVDGIRYALKGNEAIVATQPGTIKEAVIPESIVYEMRVFSVTGMVDYAFYYCEDLTRVSIPNGVDVSNYAFVHCTALTSVSMQEGVSIGEYAFSECKALEIISIPNNASIGEYAFYGCENLDGVALNGSITIIKTGAFSRCTRLVGITIPRTVAVIDYDAFELCPALTIYCEAESQPSEWNFNWNSNAPVVWDCNNNDVADDGYIYIMSDGTRYALKDGIATVAGQPIGNTELKIAASVTYKGQEYAVTSIGDFAFNENAYLTSIVIPDSVTTIGYSAFNGCVALTSIVIPDSITEVGAVAFGNCTDLTIYCEVETQPEGWHVNWNSSECPVVWGYKQEG